MLIYSFIYMMKDYNAFTQILPINSFSEILKSDFHYSLYSGDTIGRLMKRELVTNLVTGGLWLINLIVLIIIKVRSKKKSPAQAA